MDVSFAFLYKHLGDHMSVTCRDTAHISFFYDDLNPCKLGQVNWVLVFDQNLLGPCTQVSVCSGCNLFHPG